MPQNSGNIRHGVLWLRSHLLKPNLSPAPAASPITSLLLKKRCLGETKNYLGLGFLLTFHSLAFRKRTKLNDLLSELHNYVTGLPLSLSPSTVAKLTSLDCISRYTSKSWWFRLNAFRYWGQKLKSHQNICVDLRSSKKKGL